MIFKTPLLEKLYFTLLESYPVLSNYKNPLYKKLKDIELPDKPPVGQYFYHKLFFYNCGTIPITWNIDKIINDNPDKFVCNYYEIQKLIKIIDLNSAETQELISTLLPKGIVHHTSDIVILASFPGFPYITIIDGNHRVLENRNNLSLKLKCYELYDDIILDYLEPNSRKLAEFIYYFLHLIS